MALVVQPISSLVPAAQYVRMSDEAQQYSIENQKAAIQNYAVRHGFRVVKTYADAGKSGVIAKHRAALQQLLKDVVNGTADYKAILVYDVSRWGRFPNTDEAAHYEFLCLQSGIPLHYCAEPFENDGTASSSVLKALKRSMAAEFSRELGEKVFQGKSRLVQLGFWVGGAAGYGYRRLMVSADGRAKQVLKRGESKSLITDRILLVPGPRNEVECVRRIFSLALNGMTVTEIARTLNRDRIKHYGTIWEPQDVRNIIRNPKYAGCNVWHRRSSRLRSNVVFVESQKWITKEGAFPALIDRETFDQAQQLVPRREDYFWSDAEILRKLRRLLKRKGYLSDRLIQKTRGMPSTSTLRDRFGSYRGIYKLVDYPFLEEDNYGNPDAVSSIRLRRRIVGQLRELFPEHVTVTHLPHGHRSILRIDNAFMVSLLLCSIVSGRPEERPHWLVDPNPSEREFITLLCKLDRARTRIISYHLFPNMRLQRQTHCSYRKDPWLRTGIRLSSLSEFYPGVRRMWRRPGVSL